MLIAVIATPPLVQIIFGATICDPFNGAIFYLLMPMMTLPLSFLMLHWLTLRGYSRLKISLLFYFIIFLSLGRDLWLLYSEPQTFVYNTFWGYFQGPLYDIGIALPVGIISLSISKLSLMIIFWLLIRIKQNRPLLANQRDSFLLIPVVIILMTLFLFQDQLGITGKKEHIQNVLGGTYKTEHFQIYYPNTPSMRKKIALIAHEHEFHYQYLSKKLKINPKQKINSYIFKNSTQKKKLMGAGDTLVAKPWQRTIYLNDHPFPHPYIRHELAHVFFGYWNSHFLNIPTKGGIMPLMGLVEGFAVALEEPKEKHSLQEEMKLIKIDQKPGVMKRLLSADQFWRQNGYRAYRISGAFISFLMKTYGIVPLKKLYQTGSFKKSYPLPLSQLEQLWFKNLKTVQISPKYEAITQAKFGRPSIFKRVCPHKIHRLKRQINRNKPQKIIDQIIQLEPNNPEHQRYGCQMMLGSGKISGAKPYLKAFEKKAKDGLKKQQAIELKGDLLWHQNKISQANKQYQKLLKFPLSDDQYRRIVIKKIATEHSLITLFIFNYLIKQKQPTPWVVNFDTVPLSQLEHDIVNYLYGRRLYFQQKHDAAHFFLSKIEFTEYPLLKKETLKMMRNIYFMLGLQTKLKNTIKKLHPLQKSAGKLARDRYIRQFSNWLQQQQITPKEYLN